ncbi:amidohydrolase family protein [Paenibacillus sp. FSL R10-2734]|uniref:amidohydrolase family protein n=1 Tax=Paenibacillus sp. FSL R10-2734 TaxID=2954691 RepID=UPI0030D7AD46
MTTQDKLFYPKIDLHTHYLSPGYQRFLKERYNDFGDGVKTPRWDVSENLELMDLMNIQYAVPSISSPNINHGDKNETLELAEEVNEYGAGLVKQYPEKYGFFASLPIPHIEESIRAIRKAMNEQRATGFTLATNANGTYLGSPELDPVMEELNQYKAIVTIHPNEPHTLDKGLNKMLPSPLMEFFFDTTRTILNMLENGIFKRYPDITFIIPHAGATLPIIADRVQAALPALNPDVDPADMDIKQVMKNHYFDVAGMVLPRQLPILLELSDPKKIVYASDCPYTPDGLVTLLGRELENTTQLSDALKQDIFLNNAKALLSRG